MLRRAAWWKWRCYLFDAPRRLCYTFLSLYISRRLSEAEGKGTVVMHMSHQQ
jgi:hypothetical protein